MLQGFFQKMTFVSLTFVELLGKDAYPDLPVAYDIKMQYIKKHHPSA